MSMKKKPSIDEFLGGSPAQEPTKPKAAPAAPPAPAAEVRKQKLVRLPSTLLDDLKQRALDISKETGKRITEEALIEEFIKKGLYS